MSTKKMLFQLQRVLFSRTTLANIKYSKAFSSIPFKKSISKIKILKLCFGVSITTLSSYSIYQFYDNLNNIKALSITDDDIPAGKPQNTLPWFSLSEVQKHKNLESSIWVIFKQGVYDITEFVQMHPGGEIIMKAAGGSIEPFWLMYGVHIQEEVFELLETYRIGNISLEDSKLAMKETSGDPYAMEPPRNPLLKASSLKPFNAEPPGSILVEEFLTPSDLFYVRNHLPVPVINEDEFKLQIEGKNIKNVELSLNDIKKLPKVTITASIMCAGNRRSEMTQIKPVKGLNWEHAVVGNATWTGVRLIDVLKYAGLSQDDLDKSDIEHVHFEGLDVDLSKKPYAASIPAEKALDPRGDVILAYEMNGEPIPRDHGYPLRAVVPGVVGARNVKWLGKIILSEKESDSHWQQNDYKGFSPSTDWDTVDFTKSPAIQELPVISAICKPSENETIKLVNNELEVKGYAWSGGGKRIVRVDVTIDQGKTWHVANFTAQDREAKSNRHWGWTLWNVKIPVENNNKKIEIWAKAVDSSYNTQPESFSNIWNLRGVLANAYHRIKVNTS